MFILPFGHHCVFSRDLSYSGDVVSEQRFF